ncbi:MAG: Nif3-like dinuclear metal center hexameric protein [Gemmatimonadaceae bacterium]|nr:Nif3-like dinuclear metal center hexameric protein [Gemmatimonadaceae bacterium]MDQ3519932.1 Nif3-like dinuclear metal center hexameric protein [Gemmatimonadota bacterium]
MEALGTIVGALDDFFGIADSGADPAFARFLPVAYEAHPMPWRAWVEPAFATHFNGLMIRGDDRVNAVFLAAFPSDFVLRQFLARGTPGDLLFVHHPIDLESGDPHGAWGRFFKPISAEVLRDIQDAHLSIYSCHAPLDYHPTLSTSRSIALALGGTIAGEFFPYGKGHAGVLAEIPPIGVSELEQTLRHLFGVPYLDTAGGHPPVIRAIAIVAGAGDRVDQMEIAESKGAEAYITGEIHSRIDTDYGHTKFADVERFAAQTGMALVGVSHAASEFLVMKTDMQHWFRERWPLATVLLPESHWWR